MVVGSGKRCSSVSGAGRCGSIGGGSSVASIGSNSGGGSSVLFSPVNLEKVSVNNFAKVHVNILNLPVNVLTQI